MLDVSKIPSENERQNINKDFEKREKRSLAEKKVAARIPAN
jgi:hypothetical protein